MEKNINGCPVCKRVCRTDMLSCLSGEVGGQNQNQNQNQNQGQNHNYACGGDGSCLDNLPLAYVYAPSQKFRMLYSAGDALKHGTLFEELYKPMGVYGNE